MLILPTKGKWFQMILNRTKPEEYREMKPYYRKRFQAIGLLDAYGLPTVNQVNVMFRNGYSSNAPSFIANVSLDIKTGREEWGAEPGKEYYTLRIHEINKDIESCILRGVEPAEDKRPCIGYGTEQSDEPCEMCKGCSKCSGNDMEE